MSGRTDPDRHEAGRYEIRLKGHLDARWAAWFDGLSLSRESDGTTVIRGPIADQAALHGLLQKVRDTACRWSRSPAWTPTRRRHPATTPDNHQRRCHSQRKDCLHDLIPKDRARRGRAVHPHVHHLDRGRPRLRPDPERPQLHHRRRRRHARVPGRVPRAVPHHHQHRLRRRAVPAAQAAERGPRPRLRRRPHRRVHLHPRRPPQPAGHRDPAADGDRAPTPARSSRSASRSSPSTTGRSCSAPASPTASAPG